MSNLKKDIEKIWDILGYWKTGKIHIKWWIDEDGCRVDCTDEIAEATTQIINLIESVIGEDEVPPIGEQGAFDPKTRTFELITDTPALKYHIQRVMNRNELRADIKSKLIGKG